MNEEENEKASHKEKFEGFDTAPKVHHKGYYAVIPAEFVEKL